MSLQISSQTSAALSPKSYGNPVVAKHLGGTQGEVAAECAQWIEDNNDFYQQVMNGTAQVSVQEAQTFLNWWAYAQQTARGAIQGSGWGNEVGSSYGQAPSAKLPAGAIEGIDGKLVFNQETADISFNGDERPVHVWSNEIKLGIPSLSAKVSCEVTMDPSLQPAEEVLRVIVTDPASGKSTAYFVHDYADATLQVKTPKQAQLEDSTKTIVWSEYSEIKVAENASANFNVKGEKQDDGSYLFEDATNVQYQSSPLGKDENGIAKTQTSEVFGHMNLNLAPSDHVKVTSGNPKDKTGYTITVSHKDGSKDVITTHQNGKNGYQININGLGAQIDWAGVNGESGVPGEFKTAFSLNGSDTGTGVDSAEAMDAQSIVDGFMKDGGFSNEDQMIAAFKSAGFTYDSVDDFKEAVDKGEFPPKTPDAKLVNLLIAMDEKLKNAIKETNAVVNQYAGKSDYDAKVKPKMQKAMDRLEELLKQHYPKSIVEMGDATGQQGLKLAGGSFTIKNSDGTSNTHEIYLDPNGNFYI